MNLGTMLIIILLSIVVFGLGTNYMVGTITRPDNAHGISMYDPVTSTRGTKGSITHIKCRDDSCSYWVTWEPSMDRNTYSLKQITNFKRNENVWINRHD